MRLTLDPDKYDLRAGTKTAWKSFDAAELEANMPSRSVVAFITTDAVDEEGDVVLPEGIDASRFRKSGTVFWNHEYDKPCGTCDGMSKTPRGIKARTVFPRRPEGHVGTWLADDAWALFSSDPPIVKTFSIGFAYLETRPPTTKDIDRFGDKAKQVVSKARLLEYSVAPLPMNEDALALAVQKGSLPPTTARRLYGRRVKLAPVAAAGGLVVERGRSIEEVTQEERERALGRVFAAS